VDTHANLRDVVFDADRDEVLARAAKAGIAAVIAVAENPADAHQNLELADAHPLIRPPAGLYPALLSLLQAEEMPTSYAGIVTG
jgi:TatD DNase family protein